MSRSSLNEQHYVQFNSSSLDSIDEQEMANEENGRHHGSSDYEDMKTATFVDFNDNYTFIWSEI